MANDDEVVPHDGTMSLSSGREASGYVVVTRGVGSEKR